MNKIVIEDEQIIKEYDSKALVVDYQKAKNSYEINNLTIDVNVNSVIELKNISKHENKLNITINLKENSKLELLEYNNSLKTKVKIVYNLEKDSYLNVYKFNDCQGWRELNIINLNGQNSTINYNLNTIAKLDEKYDLMFYHRESNTNANIYCHGVSMEKGNLIFNVTNTVYQGMHNANINQNSRIVTLNDNKCQINPNLLIDEYDVSASHSAIVGRFSDEELFYLTSRGINYNQAHSLLIKGFLLNGLNTQLFDKSIFVQIIDKYWR